MTQLSFRWQPRRSCMGIKNLGVVPRTDTQEISDYIARGGYATVREFEVYKLCISEGRSKATAASILGVSFEAVRLYLRNLRRRVRNPGQDGIKRARGPLIRSVA